MSRTLIKKHDVAAIWLHWFNAIVWLLMLVTGAGLFSSPDYAIAPGHARHLFENVFGDRATMLRFHVGLGMIWTTVLLVYGIFGFRHYLMSFLRHDLVLDRDDLVWLKNKFLRIIGRPVPLPEQGVYNAGQKLYGAVIAVSTVAIVVTGFIMALHLGPVWLVRWAIPLHFAAVGGVLAGLIVHVYMAAILPEERPAFFSMFSGKVPELYAYEHHRKWWREVKAAEAQFAGRDVQAEPAPGAEADDRREPRP